MPPTIKDVARLAGCSIKTVSRVINAEPHVSPEVQARVQAAIRACGYAPNQAARSLVRRRSFALCVLRYPGFSQTASGLLPRLLDLAYEENYDILFQNYYPSFPASRRKLAELVGQRRFDGFVTTPPCDAEGFVADLLATYKVPLVQVNPLERSHVPYPSGEGGAWVAGDDALGARLAMQHLLALGHKRIAFLAGPRNLRSSAERLEGYRLALQRAGIPFDPALVQDTEFTFDGGLTALRLLARLERRPTALYAANDEAAHGALFAAGELGWRVPGQLSICGHDDLPYSASIWPGLTSVHQPPEELLEAAVRLLIALLKNGPPPQPHLVLPPRLAVRGSTAPPDPAQR